MDSVTEKEDKNVVLPSIDEDKKIPLECSKKSFNIGNVIDQKHEEIKNMQCYVKVNERKYSRSWRNFLLSIIISLMIIVFVNICMEIYKTWYFDGYNEYDFDYEGDFWCNLANRLLTLR